MRRILFFSYSMNGGGAEKFCQLLVNRFAKEKGFKLYLFLISKEGAYLRDIKNSVKIISPPKFFAGYKVFVFFYLLAKIRTLNIDSILSIAEWPNFFSGLVKFFTNKNVKFIFSEQNTKTFINYPGIYGVSRFVQSLSIRSYKNADAIVCCSKRVLEEVDAVVESGFKFVIYNPVDCKYAQKMSQACVDVVFSSSKINFVAVGRFHPQKDYMTMLEAFELAYASNPNIVLYILGDGELRVEIEDKIKSLRSGGAIKLLGFVENPFAYLDKSDALLHSATFEGFGNVFIEALATGTPVITTDCDTPKEIIVNNLQGRIVPVKDVQELANAILAQPKKTAAVIESCKQRSGFFDIENCFEKFRRIL